MINVIEAQRQIAAILQDLEKSTGQQVESIRLRTDEVTQMSDQSPTFKRSIQVGMIRKEISSWNQ